MEERYVQKFRITCDRAWSWHFGAFFCIEPRDERTGKADIYVFICIGKYDIAIGRIGRWED